MRSKNTKKYAKYYILLEKCIKYYNDYQLELNKKYIIKLKNKNKENKIIIKEKDDKIDRLEELITITNNKLSKLKSQNSELIDSVEDLKDDNEEIHNKLDITIRKLNISTEERVINPNNNQQLENFIIFRSRKKIIDFKYYVIRCQIRNTVSKVKRLEDDKYKNVLEINNITNSIKFWNFIKEKYKNNLVFEGNKFNIINIDWKVLLDNINSSYNNRKNIDLDIYEELED
jgi:small-conductance mechanosensitive channel